MNHARQRPARSALAAMAATSRRRFPVAVLASVLLLSATADAAVLRVGPGEQYDQVAKAARAAGDGDIVEILPGEYHGDVAVWKQKQLTIRGVGERPVLIADGKIAEGKAIWVIRGGNFLIDNLEFRGARANDGNGAGIRLERGRLEVRNSTFIDNQTGILTANAADIELVIHDSIFAQAPRQEHSLPHLLYAGRIGRLEVHGSRFHQGYRGHLLKSRAAFNDIRYNLLYDGPAGEASYEIDLPNGGLCYLVGNIISQSAQTQNPIMIAYGAEGSVWPQSALYLAHNTLANERHAGGWFLRTFTEKLPPGTEIVGINNLTVGIGAFTLAASGDFHGNIPLPPGGLKDPDILDFRPRAAQLLRHFTVPAAELDPLLQPAAEFGLPIGTRPLARGTRLLPGAVQSDD